MSETVAVKPCRPPPPPPLDSQPPPLPAVLPLLGCFPRSARHHSGLAPRGRRAGGSAGVVGRPRSTTIPTRTTRSTRATTTSPTRPARQPRPRAQAWWPRPVGPSPAPAAEAAWCTGTAAEATDGIIAARSAASGGREQDRQVARTVTRRRMTGHVSPASGDESVCARDVCREPTGDRVASSHMQLDVNIGTLVAKHVDQPRKGERRGDSRRSSDDGEPECESLVSDSCHSECPSQSSRASLSLSRVAAIASRRRSAACRRPRGDGRNVPSISPVAIVSVVSCHSRQPRGQSCHPRQPPSVTVLAFCMGLKISSRRELCVSCTLLGSCLPTLARSLTAPLGPITAAIGGPTSWTYWPQRSSTSPSRNFFPSPTCDCVDFYGWPASS
jgi:hypothetical protein